MTTEQLERAFASTRAVLESVKPDQYDDPTPCESWKVRDLINHIVAGAHWFASSTNAGVSPDDGGDSPDFTEGDVVASFDAG